MANGFSSRGRAFLNVLMQIIFGLDEHEIAEHCTDGGNDFGVDAIYIDHDAEPAAVHILQFKCHENFKAQDRSYPENSTERIHNFFSCLMSRDTGLNGQSHPKLREKIKEIYELMELEVPKFYVHFCSNGAVMPASVMANYEARLSHFGTVDVYQHDLTTIVSRFVDEKRPKFDAKIRGSGLQLFERSTGNIRGLIVTVSGSEFIKLIESKHYKDRINEGIFHENIRVFLGFSNPINEKIFDSALSERNYKFWYLNNGITIVCDHFEYQPQLESPVISLENFQVVNGRQTSNAVFEAHLNDRKHVDSISLLLRVYETRDINLTREIAEATNSQSRIALRNLRSTDRIQRQLADFFEDRGFKYQRVPREFEALPNAKKIDSLKLGQVCLAYFEGAPERAKTSSDQIFGGYYEDIFNKNLDMESALKIYSLFVLIERKIEEIEDGNNIELKKRYSFAVYSKYHFIYTFKLLSEKNNEEISEDNFDQYFAEAAEIVGRIMHGSGKSAYEVFRSVRTKEAIVGVIRGDQRDLFQ